MRGRFFFNLDSGGSGRITSAGSNFDGTVLGGTGGVQNRTIAQANLPNVSFNVSGITLNNGTASSAVGNYSNAPLTNGANAIQANGLGSGAIDFRANPNLQVVSNFTVTSQGSAASGGSGSALATLPPSMGINCMMRIA